MFARKPPEPLRKAVPPSRPKPLPQPKSIAELKETLAGQKKAGGAPPAPAESSRSAAGLQSGMRVRHEQFGDGIILRRERMGNDFKLVITFSRVGRKSLVEKFAKLKVL